MTRDPRVGLTRRYTLDEILELHGGKNRIQPLNYDAPTMLRNPLYIKMGQTLSDDNTNQNSKLLAELERQNATRALASETGLPLDQLEELLKRLLKKEDDDKGGGGGGASSSDQPIQPPKKPRDPTDDPEGHHPASEFTPGSMTQFSRDRPNNDNPRKRGEQGESLVDLPQQH